MQRLYGLIHDNDSQVSINALCVLDEVERHMQQVSIKVITPSCLEKEDSRDDSVIVLLMFV